MTIYNHTKITNKYIKIVNEVGMGYKNANKQE